jgi:hypothetical protein
MAKKKADIPIQAAGPWRADQPAELMNDRV